GFGGRFSNTGGGIALKVEGTAQVNALEVLGADLAEKFDVTEKVKPGMVVAIDPAHEGRLRLAKGAYNTRVAGIVSGAGIPPARVILTQPTGKAGAQPIAMSGRVWVYCDATRRAIEPGDFLTTAQRPGHAMAVRDLAKAQGAILGKAMTRLAKGKTG